MSGMKWIKYLRGISQYSLSTDSTLSTQTFQKRFENFHTNFYVVSRCIKFQIMHVEYKKQVKQLLMIIKMEQFIYSICIMKQLT